jgi:hypothetical protein
VVLVTLRGLKRFLGSLLTSRAFPETSPYEPQRVFHNLLNDSTDVFSFRCEFALSKRTYENIRKDKSIEESLEDGINACMKESVSSP